MNDLDDYARLIADRTGIFVSDVRKVLAEIQVLGGLPIVNSGDSRRFQSNDVRGVYGKMTMGNPG
jgi:hypothetical protein